MLHDLLSLFIFFFFNDTATTEIYTLSLHDALPISLHTADLLPVEVPWRGTPHSPAMLFETPERQLIPFSPFDSSLGSLDRKSTRLNSSHLVISYAVFCLKKKKRPSQRVPRNRAAHS